MTMKIDESREIPAAKKRLFEELQAGTKRPAFVLGCNACARNVARRFAVAAFIDDAVQEATFLGKPIVRMAQAPRDALVVSCPVTLPLTAQARLRQHGFRDVLDYFALNNLDRCSFPDVDHFENCQADIDAHRDKYDWLHGRLADDTSRALLEQICNFRYTMNLDWLQGIVPDVENQYFDDCMVFRPDEVFVDGGGFKGETSLRFARRCPGHRGIYYFEPSPELMAESRQNLAGLETVHFVQKGLSRQTGQASFDTTRGVGNRVCEGGSTRIDLVGLAQVRQLRGQKFGFPRKLEGQA
ncbi:MAG: hypothetical protein EOL90_06860 [Spartobacteria bacterium]|nr:hypothetical protein [Spartobacteria bacterium]